MARLEELAQTADMDVDRTLLDVGVRPPHTVEELPAREHALGIGGEELQQAELRRAELDGLAVTGDAVAAQVDGELARLKDRATRFGGVFDAVTDRYADAVMLAGMTVYAVRFEDHPRPEFVGALALGAALIVSYSRARIEADLPDVAASGNLDSIFGLASRDVRLLVAAIGTVVGQCYWTLIILAAVSGLTIAWRLLYLRITVGGRRLPPG